MTALHPPIACARTFAFTRQPTAGWISRVRRQRGTNGMNRTGERGMYAALVPAKRRAPATIARRNPEPHE